MVQMITIMQVLSKMSTVLLILMEFKFKAQRRWSGLPLYSFHFQLADVRYFLFSFFKNVLLFRIRFNLCVHVCLSILMTTRANTVQFKLGKAKDATAEDVRDREIK